MPKVSVVVPIYGVEKYIEKCLRSLFEQTLDDIEYVFVDDCTIDKSIEILETVLDEYPQRKSQTKIVHHKENKGLPQARKTGVENASGDYIAHCDSDDWVALDAYEKAYKQASLTNSDIVFFDFYRCEGEHYYPFKKKLPSKKNDLIRSVFTRYDASQIWAVLVKRDVYKNDIICPVCNQAEDITLMFQLIFFSNSYTSLNEKLYFYRLNPVSMTRVKGKENEMKRFNQVLSNFNVIFKFCENHGLEDICKKEIIFTKWKFNNRSKKLCQKSNIFPGLSFKDIVFNSVIWQYYFFKLFPIHKLLRRLGI